ncbi:MAG: hypothetical protein CMA87_05535, partial [Euryarchaeota archaeon]|nr:hypothetical protein [Euryarchaeota archaeon]
TQLSHSRWDDYREHDLTVGAHDTIIEEESRDREHAPLMAHLYRLKVLGQECSGVCCRHLKEGADPCMEVIAP